MNAEYALQGQVVVITGAAGGIGRALAQAFAAQGASLWLIDRAAESLQRITSELSTSSAVHSAVCDLGNDVDVAELAHTIRQQSGSVDVLVNNAGTEYPTPLTHRSAAAGPGCALDSALSSALSEREGAEREPAKAMAAWAQLLDNNVVSMARLIHALLPLMPQGARIINQSSIWGKSAVADFSAYVASKHAVIGLTRSLAWELGPRGIRVNAVCPGWIRTDAALRSLAAMAAQQDRTEAEVERELLSRQAIPVMLAPPDIAGVFLFLASRDAASLTGQALVASHGEVMS